MRQKWSGWPNPELGGMVILENYPAVLYPSFFQDHLPWDSSKQVPEGNKICPDEVCNWDLDFFFALLSWDLEFLLMKTDLELQS